MDVLMVAAENDALPGGKVGGIGDVVRDVPRALSEKGCQVTVLTPAYGVFAKLADAQLVAELTVRFGGADQQISVYEIPGRIPVPGVRHVVLDHVLFNIGGPGKIYCDDPPERPFATDASKFALLCAAVADCLIQDVIDRPDVIHLHDWHAALFLVLRQFHPAYRALRTLRCVYTIHNLALQGIRPFAGDESSLGTWYPELSVERGVLADPRWSDCINAMAVGIRLADAVHVVSPAYAKEILQPSAVEERGYFGGEGLEVDLQKACDERRLFGILNGCEYPKNHASDDTSWEQLMSLMRSLVRRWIASRASVSSAQFLAHAHLNDWGNQRPSMVLTSVGRLTDQKLRLLSQLTSRGQSALEEVLQTIGEHGVFVLLGSGDPDYEEFLIEITATHDNFLFLRGYSDALASMLYQQGDLFLMPSSFEPCGISQMLAMRAGQPCLVHHVGGLKDTVHDGETGFAFAGATPMEQADNCVSGVQRAMSEYHEHPENWKAIAQAAANERFSWSASIDRYIEDLYQPQLSEHPG